MSRLTRGRPAESHDHKAVAEILLSAGWSPQIVHRAPTILNLPFELRMVLPAADGYRQLAKWLLRVDPYPVREDLMLIARWGGAMQACLQEIVEALGNGTKLPEGCVEGENPFVGLCAHSHPCMPMSLNQSRNPAARPAYRALVSHTFKAYIWLQGMEVTREKYLNHHDATPMSGPARYIAVAAVALRRLSEDRYAKHICGLNPERPTLEFLADPRWHSGEYIPQPLKCVHAFLVNAFGYARWRTDKPRGSGHRGGAPWLYGYHASGDGPVEYGSYLEDRDDPVLNLGAHAEFHDVNYDRKRANEEQRREIELLGLCDAEFVSGPTLAVSRAGLVFDPDGPEPRIITRHQSYHVERKNQMLPFSYDVLDGDEVRYVLESTASLFEKYAAQYRRGKKKILRQTLEALAAIRISLLLGRSIKEIAKCRVWYSGLTVTEPLVLILQGGICEWQMEALAPQYRTPDISDPDIVEIPEPYFHIPDIGNASKHLVEILKMFQPPRGAKAFQSGGDVLGMEATRILKELPGNKSNRITQAKIRNTLFSVLCGEAPRVYAAQLTGSADSTVGPKLHYQTIPVTLLRRAYGAAILEMTRDSMGALSSATVARCSSLFALDSSYIGARYRPRQEVIRSIIRELRNDIQKSDLVRLVDLSDYHNRMLLHMVLYLMFSSGYRPVIDVIVEVEQVMTEVNAMVIRDKDGEDRHHTRLSYISPGVVEQMGHWRDHCRSLTSRISPIAAEDPAVLRGDFFLLSDDLEIIRARPSTLIEILAEYVTLPLNFPRKAMCCWLTEAGVAADLVDSWMGHWSCGESPWSSRSMLSPPAYLREVGPVVDRILNEMGFRPIRSKLVSL